MTIHLQNEMEKIKKRILSLGSMVEERVRLALKAIDSGDMGVVTHIIATDYEIDETEVEVEEECLKLLALYQPVAIDLRFLICVIKINNDLERIGDEAVNIAERVQTICKAGKQVFPYRYSAMAEKAQIMLKNSLDAFVNLDIDLAFKVLLMDDEVDALHRNSYDAVKASIKDMPDQIGGLINYYLISRHIERLADHATNIAEEVVYLVEGQIVRHEKF